ncbi:unnamed protein product, partial [Didymodactylos carnosus]
MNINKRCGLFFVLQMQLLRNICNWLTGLARDWYLQLLQSHQLPDTWPEFKKLFLSRFRSPERIEALKLERSRCVQRQNETAADFYQRYLGLNLEISPGMREKLLKKHFLRKLRPELLLWMKGDPDSMSLEEVLKKAEKAEIQLLYRRKGEIQRTMPVSCFSSNADCDQDDESPRELTSSVTRQLARLKTPEKTVIVANLEQSSPPSTTFSEATNEKNTSSDYSPKNERNNTDFRQKPTATFYGRYNNNNNRNQNSNNNQSLLPFSRNQSSFNRENSSSENGNKEPPGPCPICHKNGHWKRDCRVPCAI